ncbi:putative phosphatase phospho1 [Lobosporangium transversale]|uniref:Phosphatase phospho-type n=1 Tax=Lobosporangium transversale TaxID=64571 RepID=A0A1Y2GXG4_9FUNG|nr:phosphatase phospho-type [Lobosporangium transversale]KAF9917513.1 putative phosphatase phospho1 [Lobosporangium transversale]ORZ26955.1 phosphatase phospho-type [Lobosporangium transversale]|eukprot:XP_021884702.1 phosphatase phospho-type [Lobosporangium transversale]
MPTSIISKRLVVFDFDWTLIETDSDYWIAEHFGQEFAQQQQDLFDKVQWTDLQDLLLGQMHQRGVTRQDLEKSLKEIPFAPEMIAALRLMKSQGAELCIISDANTFYIDTILKVHDLDQLFTKVITNPGHFDKDGRLRIKRYHDIDQEPHGCSFPCHVNLCKGRELQKLMDAQEWDQVIYMGDSTNDFCPSARLLKERGDIVLARANLLLEKNIKEHPELVKAKVIYWESPQHAFEIIKSIFNVSNV